MWRCGGTKEASKRLSGKYMAKKFGEDNQTRYQGAVLNRYIYSSCVSPGIDLEFMHNMH